MENNSDALDNFFDTNFSNQELKARYEEFYEYLCENGTRRDFDRAKARDQKACFDVFSYGAAAFTVNFLHKDKLLDENDKINEINAILPVFEFKLAENTTKSEIENISNTIEKIFFAIMSVDPKIFDIKSFDFFMSDDVDAERYMKIYDAAWVARDAWCLVDTYLDILERNEKLDEEAERYPDRKGNYNNLKVKLALDRNEFAEVANRLHQIRLLRNYTVRLLDDLFVHSDSLPIEIAKFAKSDLWEMKHFKPICEKQGWKQAIMMRESIVSKHIGPRDFTLDAIRKLKDAAPEKDIIKKLEINISVLTEEKGERTEELDKSEKELEKQTEEKESKEGNNEEKSNHELKENNQIREQLTAQIKKNENQLEVNKLEKEKLEGAKKPEKQETKLNQKAETKEINEEKDGKDNSDEKENEKRQETAPTAQIKGNEKEKENRAIIPKLNKKENLSTLTSQVKCFRNFSEFLNKLKNENLTQSIISGLACNNFSVLDMICAFVWVVCHFWQRPKGIGVVDVARIKVTYDNIISGGILCDNIRDAESEGRLTAISELINIAIEKLNKEKNMASVDEEKQEQKEVAKI